MKETQRGVEQKKRNEGLNEAYKLKEEVKRKDGLEGMRRKNH